MRKTDLEDFKASTDIYLTDYSWSAGRLPAVLHQIGILLKCLSGGDVFGLSRPGDN